MESAMQNKSGSQVSGVSEKLQTAVCAVSRHDRTGANQD